MANNKIIVKRTTTSGRQPNTTGSYSTNSQYIGAGELALNMADGILYSSNGSAVIEVGANNTNVNVSGNLTVNGIIANGSIGTAGQTLTSNGSATYWATSAGSGTVTSVATGNGMTGGPITSSGTVSVLANTGIVANATGVFVNAAYINTIASNSATYANSSVTNTFTVGTGTYFVAGGNVGIGNTAPDAKLTVTGTANISGNVVIGGGLTSANLTTTTNTATIGTSVYIIANGNVGIKTSSPGAYSLYTSGNSYFTGYLGVGLSTSTARQFGVGNTAINLDGTYYLTNFTGTIANSSLTAARTYGTGYNMLENDSQALNADGVTRYNNTLYTQQAYLYNGDPTTGGDAYISTAYGGYFDIRNYANGTSNSTIGTAFGNRALVRTFNSGTIDIAYGYRSDVYPAAASATVTGNITTGYAYYGQVGLNSANASMTTGYLYYGTFPTSANVTTKYGVYITGEGINYFSSNVGIGNTAPNAKLQVTGTANVSGNVAIGGITTFSANIVLGTSGVSSNGSFGTAGQVLTSNASATYWSTPTTGTVTSVATGDGMTGGTITSTGTISVVANTGIVSNSTGVFVNSSYIATISSNSATYANSSVTNTFTVGTATYFVSNGNVGIGNTAPNAKLQVTGTANVSGNVVIGGDLSVVGTSAFGAATIASTTSPVQVSGDISLIGSNKSIHGNLYYAGGWKYGGNGYGWGFREDNAGKLQMLSAGNNTSGAGAAATVSLSDLFTFDLVNNRVGLGNTAPNAKLQVTGTANVSSDVAIGGILTVAANTSSARYVLTNTNGVSSVGDTSGWMFTGAGYVYLNQSGYTYSQSRIVARSGISDDVNATLTLYGGTGGYTTVSGSTRSPLFYDSDNTSYYVNPDNGGFVLRGGTSNRVTFTTSDSGILVNGAEGSTSEVRVGAAWGRPGIYNYAGLTLATDSTNPIDFVIANAVKANLSSTGILTVTGDVRTPILYDSNNTGYFIDGNNTSALVRLGLYYAADALYFDRAAGNNSYIRWYTSGSARFDFGIDSAAESGSNAGSNLFINTNSDTGVYIGTALTVNRAGAYVALYNAARASILYDADDTNAYIDAGTHVLRGGSPTIYFRDTDANSAMIHVNGSLFYVLRGGNDTTSWSQVNSQWPLIINLTNNDATFGGIVTAVTDVRAPIFYDSNDTGYYVNPNDASQLKGHTRFGPYAGSTSTGNVTGVEIMNNGGTGDSNAAAISFHCQSYYGTHLHLRPDGYFGAGGWSASSWRWYVYMPNGDMTAAGNVTAYSDVRLKEDITNIVSPLEKICKLNGVKFKWKNNSIIGHPGEYDYGILAHEVQEVIPEIVTESMHEAPEGDKYKTVAYDKLIPVLIEAMKEQQSQIEALRAEINTLKGVN